ncbi:hypothetical protein Rleg2_2331 [Rhizobium leguminosarum bv. trifolii WSM2304]|uniref:DUF1217 domain-containing protein n=1 Tax=Rhizobium leguminosarum bv. trifolii (strain WSM2304) TaxID=395492 RepID=A0ABF7QNS9_RHILW|nr:hypothetical protein [Rhizobium leguminosarum]ACI55606.1 hypothetical protein Rleg2_2331 [Rhizobium leguminosarum bv. trifolii WSM2304]
MLRTLTGLFGLLLLSFLISPALAADNLCPQRETILAFSDIVLADRTGLPPLIARHYGAEAAFLKIRYSELSDGEIRGLLQTLLASNVSGADDLAYAWRIQRDGYEATIAALGQEPFDRLVTTLGPSAIRALLLGEQGPDILTERLSIIAARARNNPFGPFGNAPSSIAAAIIDQPDALKEKVVLAAEAQGLSSVAALVAASENNPQAWNAFRTRNKNIQISRLVIIYASEMRAMVGNPGIELRDRYTTGEESRVHSVKMASAFEPEQDFLTRLMENTGRFRALERAARTLLQQIQSGAIKRNGSMDTAWLFAYRSATYFLGREQVESFLDISPYSGRRYVRSSGAFMLRDVIDRLLVIEALQPYLTAKEAASPPWPLGVSVKIKADWSRWTEMATRVRDGTVSTDLAVNAATFDMVTELLLAKGDLPALRLYVDQAPTREARVSVANDFAVRLDRACAAYLYHPTEAATLQGQPIFKFDTK